MAELCVLLHAGTGTVVNKTGIKQYQQATRDRSKSKTEGGKIIRVGGTPHPRAPSPKVRYFGVGAFDICLHRC